MSQMIIETTNSVDMNKIIEFVKREFKNKIDKNGESYFGHLERVATTVKERCNYDHCVALAWLHDILEDTDWTVETLQKELNLNGNFLNQLLTLTKHKNEKYEDYINKILTSNDIMVLEVKLADLKDNTDIDRLHKLWSSDKTTLDQCYRLMRKYLTAYKNIAEHLFYSCM